MDWAPQKPLLKRSYKKQIWIYIESKNFCLKKKNKTPFQKTWKPLQNKTFRENEFGTYQNRKTLFKNCVSMLDSLLNQKFQSKNNHRIQVSTKT